MLKDMKRMGGFTLVELVITIAVMLIITLMAVANFSGSQINARDADRKTDIAGIVQRLDSLYRVGMTFADGTILTQGTYPTAEQMRSATYHEEILKDVSLPGRTVTGFTPVNPATDSIVVPAIGGAISFEPSTVNHYAYVPLALDGSGNEVLCETSSQDCRRFIMRYKLESNPSTSISVRSKNQ